MALVSPLIRPSCGRDIASALRLARQQIDLDKRVARQTGDADAGPRREAAGREIGLVDRVHRRVVPFEMRQIDAREYHPLEPAAGAGQDQLQVLDDTTSLRLD